MRDLATDMLLSCQIRTNEEGDGCKKQKTC